MFKFDKGLALNVLTDAFEGDMSGWAQVERYDWQRWYENGDMDAAPIVDDDTVLFHVREENIGDGTYGEWIDLTYKLWRTSLAKAVDQYKHLFTTFDRTGWTINDMDYDAIGADVALQIAILGEVIYG